MGSGAAQDGPREDCWKHKERAMAGEVTRQEARQGILEIVGRMLDKYIPEDPSKPVKDGLFWDWEDMADEFDREVTGTFVEVLARLSGQARVEHPGACPFCGSPHVRWLKAEGQRERRSKHGEVVLPRQVAQCRSCDRSFSPSGAGVGSGCPGGPDAAGLGQGVPGIGDDTIV